MILTDRKRSKLCGLRFTLVLTIFGLVSLGINAPAVANTTVWQGSSAGHISQGDPSNDDVAFLVRLGYVQAAVGRATSYDKEEGMKNPFTAEVLEQYAQIDAYVTGKSNSSLSLQPLLSQLAAPETFSTIMDSSRSMRQQQNDIQNQMRNLTLRIDAIVTERFPSTRASALAISALMREAGELLRKGLSENGHIISETHYRDALHLVEASLRLRVNKVSACGRSQEAIKQLKPRGPLGDLVDRLIIVSSEGTLDANAGDVFAAADRLEKLGVSLPNDDSLICG